MILCMHDTYSTIFLVIEIWLGLLRGCYHVCTHILSMQRKKPLPCKVILGDFFLVFQQNIKTKSINHQCDQTIGLFPALCHGRYELWHVDTPWCGLWSPHPGVLFCSEKNLQCLQIGNWLTFSLYICAKVFLWYFSHFSYFGVHIGRNLHLCVFFALGASSWTPCEVNPCWSAISSNLIKLNSSSSLQGHLG